MDINIILGIAGLSVGVASLFAASVQTIRLTRLQREENADVWLTIRHIKQIITQIEQQESQKSNVHAARAYEAALSLFRIQLKRAVLFEKKYDLQVIKKWKNTQKISTSWQELQALNFLSTESIDETKITPADHKDT